jgi:hypothetical protein
MQTALIVNHPESSEAMLFRADIANQIADLLVQAVMLDHETRVKDLPRSENRGHYHEFAEGVVAAICDRHVVKGADYFACAGIAAANEMDFETMPLEARMKLVSDWRYGLRQWMRVFREGAPGVLRKYGLIADSDVTKVKARTAAKLTSINGGKS